MKEKCMLCGRSLVIRMGVSPFHEDPADDQPCAELWVAHCPTTNRTVELQMADMRRAREC